MISQTWWGAQGRCVCSLWVTPASWDQGHQPRCLAPCPDRRSHWGARPLQEKGQHPGPRVPPPARGGAPRTLALVLAQALGQADPWGWIPSRRSPGSAWEGVPRAAQAPRSRRKVDGRRGQPGPHRAAGGGHVQDSRGSGLLTKIGGAPLGGRTRAGRESRVAEAGGRGGGPRAVPLARGRPLTQMHDTCQRARSGRAGGGCPRIPASPRDPAPPRSERPHARAFLRHGRDRACAAAEPGSDLRRRGLGAGPKATPPRASIGWACGVL